MSYWILFIGIALVSWLVSWNLQRKFKAYSQIPLGNGMTGRDVAVKMLHDNGIDDVRVISTSGSLTDHYNPKTQQVGLSQEVYHESSVAALAVAAHEIGHVLQYEEGYVPIRVRNALLPVARFGSQAAPFIVILGLIMGSFNLAIAGVILFGVMFLFQVVTLPV